MIICADARHPSPDPRGAAHRRAHRDVPETNVPCPRPSGLWTAIVPMIDPPATPSFPSGHSLQAQLIARCLLAASPSPPMVPLHLVTDLANRVGENRIIAGLHYPHDHTVGQAVANSIFALLNTKFTTSRQHFLRPHDARQRSSSRTMRRQAVGKQANRGGQHAQYFPGRARAAELRERSTSRSGSPCARTASSLPLCEHSGNVCVPTKSPSRSSSPRRICGWRRFS